MVAVIPLGHPALWMDYMVEWLSLPPVKVKDAALTSINAFYDLTPLLVTLYRFSIPASPLACSALAVVLLMLQIESGTSYTVPVSQCEQ
jgi:hypothetical protein